MTTPAGRWLRERALPLWIEAGWDGGAAGFVEGLDFAGRPLADLPRRTMVQARQTWVLCLAARRGWHPLAAPLADRAVSALLAGAGGTGYPFSRDRRGAVVEARRDLYAHAFVLLALAEAHALTGDSACLAAADRILAFLDAAMATPETGGYAEALPAPPPPRRQNPHMHLFEALLALHEADCGRGYLARAAALHALFCRRFLHGPLPVLAEWFDAAWRPLDAPDIAFEPGHHFEWVWLLDRFARLADRPDAARPGRGLWRAAMAHGVGRDLWIHEGVTAAGRVTVATTRLWAYAEAAKAATTPLVADLAGAETAGEAAGGALALRFLDALTRRFLDGDTGLWTDRRDPDGSSPSLIVPASSLYHLCGAVCAVEDRSRAAFPLDPCRVVPAAGGPAS